jgi:YVTN family beta-propeller protein
MRYQRLLHLKTNRRIRSLGMLSLACVTASAAPNVEPAGKALRSGHVLVANQQSGNASLIDLRTDSMVFIDVGEGPHEAMISPSGRVGVVTVYGTQMPGNELAVIDIATKQLRRKISLGEFTRPHGVMFLAGDESRVVVTSEATQRLVLVNLAEGRVEGSVPTNAMGSHMVGVTGDGRRAFTANVGSGGVSEIDLVSKAHVRVIPVAPRVEGIAVVPNGSAVWAGSNTNGTVSVIDMRSGTIVETLTGFSLPYRLAISADGRIAIVCDPQANKISVADVAQRKVIWTLDGLGSPRGVTIAPDGKTAFVTLNADRTLAVVDLTTRTIVRTIGVGASPDGVGFGPSF